MNNFPKMQHFSVCLCYSTKPWMAEQLKLYRESSRKRNSNIAMSPIELQRASLETKGMSGNRC